MQEECEPCQETNPLRYDQFFELLEVEMENKVKEIDQLKDSVRKERQGFISIIETIVKDTFSNRYGNGYVGIKTFGSMATELAIETSDVDLVVTGIDSFQSSYNYGREYSGKNQLLRMMQKLYDNLCYLKDKGLIYKIKFIQGANVPIIKLVADLQMINKSQIEKAIERINQEREEDEESGEQKEERKRRSVDLSELGLEAKEIAPTMRYLQVDISIDEQSHQYLKFDNKGFGNAPRNHSGIDTIYHIQDLVKKRKDLRPIVMIMKKIFDGTFLSMPYYGGISSYSLVLMVSAYLKAYDAEKEASISRNLSSFFHFYGSQFKPHMYYLNGDEIVHCEDPAQRPFQDPFIVLDPLETSNNISHSTFRIKDIQRALVKAFIIINKSCEQYQLFQDTDISTPENTQCQPRQVLERLITEIKQEYFSPS
jgi:DNA polymerase sigma